MPYRTPEQWRREKKRRWLRQQGIFGYKPHAPVRARLLHLHDRLGIPLSVIAERASLNDEVVKKHRRGYYVEEGVRRSLRFASSSTYDAIMNARFTADDIGRFPAVGIRRRLQALQAAGFSLKLVGEIAGCDHREVHRVMHGKGRGDYVFPETARRYIAAYEKLEGADPADFGVAVSARGQCRTRAKANGFAPPHCWDPDTIDDPEAIPEWTGACGTMQGLRIHHRDGIPPCPPCLVARQGVREGVPRVDGGKLRRVREAKGMSLVGLAKRLNISDSSPYYWETGRSSPRSQEVFDLLLSVLDTSEEEICE